MKTIELFFGNINKSDVQLHWEETSGSLNSKEKIEYKINSKESLISIIKEDNRLVININDKYLIDGEK